MLQALTTRFSEIQVPSAIKKTVEVPIAAIIAISVIALCAKLYYGRASAVQPKPTTDQPKTTKTAQTLRSTTLSQKVWKVAKLFLPLAALMYLGRKLYLTPPALDTETYQFGLAMLEKCRAFESSRRSSH